MQYPFLLFRAYAGTIIYHSLAITFVTSNSNHDVYEWDTKTRELTRWTESEVGGADIASIPPIKMIKWKSFDGLDITGYMYRSNSSFPGKCPVVINIQVDRIHLQSQVFSEPEIIT